MKRGVWHQFGHQSQTLALDCLKQGVGVGVVMSPRDLALERAMERAAEYRPLGADVLLDPQFHIPDFTNDPIATYPLNAQRISVSTWKSLGAAELDALAKSLEATNRSLQSSAVIAPAVIREAGRPDLDALNSRLFAAGKRAGDALGVPTYATVVLGNSTLGSDATIAAALAPATSVQADGYYFACEFLSDRLPTDQVRVRRFLGAGLTLAATGKPVMHAFAGPMAVLSFGFGAQASAVGHTRNLWQFDRARFGPTPDQGGGPVDPPSPRLFSEPLWGTIVYPDETSQLSAALLAEVLSPTPFCGAVTAVPPQALSKGDAQRHLVHSVGRGVAAIAAKTSARACASDACTLLQGARALHQKVAAAGVLLRDSTGSYQQPWRDAMLSLVADRPADYDYLELLT